jgi:cathepsin X
VDNPKKWFLKNFGYVAGAEKMKQEIFERGPITCGIEATKNFQQYSGGIFSQKLKFPRTNHIVSIVGWGSENSTEFWIGRNSWGTNWGESGYFQIQMHSDNLGVETDCSYGVPSLQPNNPKSHSP